MEEKKRIRAVGGGRKPIDEYDPTLRRDLELLVDPVTRGDPESPLLWTCKSTRQLVAALLEPGHVVGRQKVADLLAELGYSLQANKKTQGSANHPDRDQQFNYINEQAMAFQHRRTFSNISMNWRGRPLISHEVIVNLIGSTTTQSGLTIIAELDINLYPKGVRISDEELGAVNLTKASFHGEWNYTID